MLIVKKVIKKMLPVKLREILGTLSEQQSKTTKNKQIAVKNHHKVTSLLRSDLPIKLELGAGERRGVTGWTYADINENCDLVLDLTQPFPFPDNSVSMIYSSHMLEHFEYHELMTLLSECLRVLKPGGIFRASVPNARIYLEAYCAPDGFRPEIFCRYEPAYNANSKIDYVNYMAYMAGHHRYMFDEENLVAVLNLAGFNNVRLRGFDKTLDLEVRDFQSIYVQAEK
ncbi:methyltransferase domain-containing protein [Deltaproteobacteria bacterium IMCC39524]|nr:methyltransferase domain-containing protein [Deltaproteobacteria bacterium IMCC39524]